MWSPGMGVTWGVHFYPKTYEWAKPRLFLRIFQKCICDFNLANCVDLAYLSFCFVFE
jgi:hypothetical protein